VRSAPPLVLLALSVAGAVVWLTLVLASPGGSVQYARTVSGAQRGASAQLRELDGAAELHVSGLAPAGAGRAYQVWLLTGSASPRATDVLFTVTRRGTATVAVPGSLQNVRELLVTAEPRGGSVRPSRRPALAVVLPAASG
jgi:anti-sigma-K factor RskA